ncbi:MAG: hypothetical protein RQ936_01030 [Gammaproteobacteria bacterium]|nr:hypothetical protein [Gammaproteobacteria bacterium]
MKVISVFVVLFLTIAISLPYGMFARMGFEGDYLMAALAAMVLALLVRNRQIYLIVLVVLCTLAANLPETIVADWYVDPDYFLGILLALVILPIGTQSSGRH